MISYLLKDAPKNRSFTLDFSRSSLRPEKVTQILGSVNTEVSGNNIKLGEIKINLPQEDLEQYKALIASNIQSLKKISSSSFINLDNDFLKEILNANECRINISNLYFNHDQIGFLNRNDRKISVKLPDQDNYFNNTGFINQNRGIINGISYQYCEFNDISVLYENGWVTSCDEFTNKADKYLGNCRLLSLKSYPSDYDGFCKTNREGNILNLTIRDDEKNNVMEFYKAKDSDNLELIYYRKNWVSQQSSIPQELAGLTINPKDINSAFVTRLKEAYIGKDFSDFIPAGVIESPTSSSLSSQEKGKESDNQI